GQGAERQRLPAFPARPARRRGELRGRPRAEPARTQLRPWAARHQAAALRHARPGALLRRAPGGAAAASLSAAALVLFSGGQDSTTCLAWALERYDRVETIGFDYRQRHRVELDCRGRILSLLKSKSAWKARLGEDHVID